MRIGSQREIFTLQRKVQVGVNAVNEPNIVWQSWRPEIFCEVEVRRGKEQFDPVSRIRYSEEVWRFRTRYDEVEGIDNTMRILHEDQTFDIKAVLPDAQRHWDCVIECTVQDSVLGRKPLSANITDFIELGVVGSAYAGFTIVAAGGVAPYVFVAESGTLPPGLSVNSGTGAISGTPTVAGEYQVSIQVSDASGTQEQLPGFTIVIEDT